MRTGAVEGAYAAFFAGGRVVAGGVGSRGGPTAGGGIEADEGTCSIGKEAELTNMDLCALSRDMSLVFASSPSQISQGVSESKKN